MKEKVEMNSSSLQNLNYQSIKPGGWGGRRGHRVSVIASALYPLTVRGLLHDYEDEDTEGIERKAALCHPHWDGTLGWEGKVLVFSRKIMLLYGVKGW